MPVPDRSPHSDPRYTLDAPGNFTERQIDSIRNAIAAVLPDGWSCSLCRGTEAIIANGVAMVELRSRMGADATLRLMPSIVLVCQTCGHEDFMNLAVLGLFDEFA